MRFFTLCLAIALTLHAAGAEQKLAFERNGAVWIAKADGSGAKKLVRGVNPQISPDGTRIAFNTESGGGGKFERVIAIADAASGSVVKLTEVPSGNCYGPVWSPDGTHLLFRIFDEHDWAIGLVRADGTGFRILKKPTKDDRAVHSATFARDGQSVFCQDLLKIDRVALDGRKIASWDVQKISGGGTLNSGARLEVSPDGTRLLVDVDMDEEVTRKDWDGPPAAVWSLDLASGKATRITPPKVFGWDACWAGENEILHVMMPPGEKETSIYRRSLEPGAKPKLVARSARTPSISQR